MASFASEENFESHDDCFYSDNETNYSDTEFQKYLEKTKENLFRISQKRCFSESRISNRKEDPLKNATSFKQSNSASKEPLDSFKNFVLDLQDCMPSPLKNVENFSEKLSEKLSPTLDPGTKSFSDDDKNNSDIGFTKFITQLHKNLQEQNVISHKPLKGSNPPSDSSTDDLERKIPKNGGKKYLQADLEYDSDSSNESFYSSKSTSTEDSEGEDFEKFISTMKSNLRSEFTANSATPLSLKSKNPLMKRRSRSLVNEDSPNEANSICKRSQSVTNHTEFNLVSAEAEAEYNFMKKRKMYASQLYQFFNKTVFNKKLPEDMLLKWSGQLKSTAGKAFCRRKKGPDGLYEYSCYIELSTEVLISFDRLRDTLIHEMCHAACWLVNHSYDKHGPLWKTWASRCNLILPQIKVPTRCHEYELSYAYTLKCVKCDFMRKRHHMCPKLKRKICPVCNSPTILTKA